MLVHAPGTLLREDAPMHRIVGPRGPLAVVATLLGFLVASPAGAAGADPVDEGTAEAMLAERYAPVMMLKEQTDDCDSTGEQFEPAPVEIVLDNPEVLLRQVGPYDPPIMAGPGASDLFRLGEGVYLDFPGDALRPGCTFERDFRRFSEGYAPTVYAHVARQPDRPDRIALQYWSFWYYNLWNNQHEGDWEGIQLVFEASSAAEALASEPISVGYAQHEGGERVEWTSSRLERDGDRPVVYSSAGSHASYFSQAVFLGRGPSEGFGCDDTTGPSRRLDPDVVVLPDAVDDADDPLAWLMFDGRWGERRPGPYNGPTGPRDKDRWTAPIDWHDGLRTSSVLVPAGDSGAAFVAQAFCTVVEWGSVQVIQFQVSPFRLLVVLALLALVGTRLVRRTVWNRVAPLPLVARRRFGQILRAVPGYARRRLPTIAVLGVVYVPVAFVVGSVVAVLRAVPFFGQLLDLSGDRAGTSIGLALFVGGLANLVAYQIVSAAVAQVIATDPGGREPHVSGIDALRAVSARARGLLAALARAIVIVLVLGVSVVGLPFALRQVVRYQFLAQAVMVDGHEGRAALARSSALVRGRWLHTAVVVGVLNVGLVVGATFVGMVLLVVLQFLPLWMFSVLVTLASALLVPLAATAQTMLYGDAVAEERGAAAALAVEGAGQPDATATDGATPSAARH